MSTTTYHSDQSRLAVRFLKSDWGSSNTHFNIWHYLWWLELVGIVATLALFCYANSILLFHKSRVTNSKNYNKKKKSSKNNARSMSWLQQFSSLDIWELLYFARKSLGFRAGRKWQNLHKSIELLRHVHVLEMEEAKMHLLWKSLHQNLITAGNFRNMILNMIKI